MAEVAREIIYHQGKPVLVVKPKHPRGNPVNFAIRMEDLWMYTPEKNPRFEPFMMEVCAMLHELFDLGIVTTKKMAEIATVIEDGIEALLAAPPENPKDEPGKMRKAREEAMLKAAMESAVKNAEVDSDSVRMAVNVEEPVHAV